MKITKKQNWVKAFEAKEKYAITPSGNIVTKVVGVSFEGRQEMLKNIRDLVRKGNEAKVVLDKRYNSYDQNAISVIVEVTDKWLESHRIGFLPKELSAEIKDINMMDLEVVDFAIMGTNRIGCQLKIVNRQPVADVFDSFIEKVDKKFGEEEPEAPKRVLMFGSAKEARMALRIKPKPTNFIVKRRKKK